MNPMMTTTEEYYCVPAYGQKPARAAKGWTGLHWLCAACAASMAAARMFAVRLPREGEPLACERCRPEKRRAAVPLTPERFLHAQLAALGLTEEARAARRESGAAKERELRADVRAIDERLTRMFAGMTFLPPPVAGKYS